MKKYLLLFVFVLSCVLAQAQIKAYQYRADDFNEGMIEQALLEAKRTGTPDWEVQQLKDHLYKKLERVRAKRKNQLLGIDDERGSNPAPLACNPACTNIGFENGNYNSWTLTSGDINYVNLPCNTCATGSGGIAAVTTLSNSGLTWGAGVDNCATNTSPLPNQPCVAPGFGNYSLCLNDNTAGGKMQEIKQSFQVTATNNIFTYAYLAVLQDGGHAAADQPYFLSQVLDGSGNVIPCTYVLQSASASITGWIASTNSTCNSLGQVNYKGWITVTLDMTAYIGQCVTIDFLVSDCNQGGHFGYCYIDADCSQINANNTVTVCPPSAQLCGPPGFLTYTWSGPVTGNTMCLNGATTGAYTLVTTGQCPAPTRYYTVTVSPTPTVAFSSTVTACSTTVPFVDQSTISGGATITNWSWNFGDGSGAVTSTTAGNTQTHSYPGSGGTYNVVLTCTSSVGCVSSATNIVTVVPCNCTPAFSAQPVCVGATTTFTNTSTAGTYSWNFGDGNTSTATNPTHTYAAAGQYVVTLTVTGTTTCTLTQTVTVNPPPTITATGGSICNGAGPTTVSGGGGVSYTWAPGGATTQVVSVNPTVTTDYTVTATDANGCINTATTVVNVVSNPTVTVANTSICAGATATLTANSNATTFAWTGSNITPPATGSVITATPAATSTYSVIASVGTCTVSTTAVVTINPAAVPAFSAPVECQGTATPFTNTSTPAGSTYNWDFGDGNTSVAASPSNTYSASGNYVVTLTVTTTLGCVGIVTNTVTVNPIPTLNQLPDITVCDQQQVVVAPFVSVPAGATVGYTNSTPSIGLSSPGTGNIAPFTGNAGGVTNVGLITAVATLNGCVGPPMTFSITVTPQPTITIASPAPYCPGDPVPSPNIVSNPVGSTVVWTNSNTQIGLAGNGTGVPPPFTALPNPNFTLANVSSVITVTPSLGGCQGPPTTYSVVVLPTPVVNPVTNVEYCPNVATAGINFTASPGGGLPTFFWAATNPAVGLGVANGTGSLPSFTTVNPGSTAVSTNILVHASLNGCTGPDVPFTITINPNPVALFGGSHGVCQGSPTNLTDESTVGTGNIVAWGWDFTNSGVYTSSTVQNPQNIFTPAGSHTVGLQVTTNKGCIADTTETIYVNYLPVPAFVGDVLVGCPIHTVNYTESSSVNPPANVVSWNWNFGNGVTSTLQIPGPLSYGNTSPTQSAFYTVSLIVTTDSGCVGTLVKNNYITVYPHPLPGFSWSPQDPAPDVDNPQIFFTDESQGASGPNNYGPNGMLWYLGDIYLTNPADNYVNNIQNPVHSYEYYDIMSPITYYVTQWVQNQYGCKDSITEPVVINPTWSFYIPNAFTPNGDGLNEGFKGTGLGIDNTTYNLWVFDRWGNMIFYANDLEKSWDGRIQGKGGDIVQEDVYVWKVKFLDFKGMKHEYKGTVSVVK